ncbi:MAG: hypothetical protein R2874_11395 [Desulfobacterales bacterium]
MIDNKPVKDPAAVEADFKAVGIRDQDIDTLKKQDSMAWQKAG